MTQYTEENKQITNDILGEGIYTQYIFHRK